MADGLHLSAEGYALFESTVLPAVAAAFPSSRLPLPAPPVTVTPPRGGPMAWSRFIAAHRDRGHLAT